MSDTPRNLGPRVRPGISKEDIDGLAAKVRYDLSSAQAKLTELVRMVAQLDIPSGEQPFNEETGLALVRNTALGYTDSSLADELARMGADPLFIDKALLVAAQVRRDAAPGESGVEGATTPASSSPSRGRPNPDYDPKIDYPERYREGPI